ncbi:MAG: CinA family protein [Lachnospiraceae bacterium]|nr:CinA family protein [Lachnospiraceae bacterium]
MSNRRTREKIYETVRKLIDKNITITCMESVSGGMLSSLLTDCEGSSAIFKGSFVTYSNAAKEAVGVPASIISDYGVYSHECARAMASAARKKMKTEMSIGITGVLANKDPANPEGQTGKVYYAIEYGSGGRCDCIDNIPLADRIESKMYVCLKIMECVDNMISSK